MDIRRLLDRPIAFHRCFVELTGSINAALMLSQAVYWSNRTSLEDGWFFKDHAEWTEETGLSRHEQVTAREKLKKTGFWQENLWGMPATVHFRIDEEGLESALQLYGKRTTSCTETPQPVVREEEKLPITETTTESTSRDVPLAFPKPKKKTERVIHRRPIRFVNDEAPRREVASGVSERGLSKTEQRQAKTKEVLERVLGNHSEDSD